MFAKVKYLLVIGLLFLITACATESSTQVANIDSSDEVSIVKEVAEIVNTATPAPAAAKAAAPAAAPAKAPAPAAAPAKSEKTFKDMPSVIQALEKHNVTDCSELWPIESGAVDAKYCNVTSSGSADTRVEFTFWEEDNAKNACIPTVILNICSEEDMEGWAKLRFYGNIHVLVYDEENGATIDSIISDLKD